MILEIVTLWYDDYVPQHWQQYLIYVALTWVAVAINIWGSGFLPLFNKMIFGLAVVTLTSTMITLFVVAHNHHASGSWMFTDTTNRTGWPSNGWAFMLAIGNAVYSYLGSDCGAHLAEEIENPAKNVPKVILYPLGMGLATAFPFTAALMYSITDIESVLDTATGLPLIEIYYQGTGSYAAASVLMAIFAFCFFANLVANGELYTGTCCLFGNKRTDPVFQRQLVRVLCGQFPETTRFHTHTYGHMCIQNSRCLSML